MVLGTSSKRAKALVAILAVGVAALLTSGGCNESDDVPEGRQVAVTIDPALFARPLSERYLGYAFDTAQFSGGLWWDIASDGRRRGEVPDLESEKLRRMVSTIRPAILRVGGTDCDAYYFCEESGTCELPASYRNTFVEDDTLRQEGVITQESVRRVADFAEGVDAEVLWCINMGPGPRDPDTGAWMPDNARALIRYAKSLPNGDRFRFWEPGNEADLFFLVFDFDPPFTFERFASDLVTFRQLIDAEDPNARVPAPGSYVSPAGEPNNFTPRLMTELANRGITPVDILSWHLYATQSTTCTGQVIDPATPENLFDEALNNQHRQWARNMLAAADGLPVWMTESASAQCGGQHQVSDTLADGLWFADWIGMMAEEGTRAMIRHALVGADYALLDPETFDPRPTFLTMVLYSRLVRGFRFNTAVDREQLKAHSFCAAGVDGALTTVVVNPGTEPLVANIGVNGATVVSAEQWTLAGATGSGPGLAAARATMNGASVASDGTVPEPAPEPVVVSDGRAYTRVAPATVQFVRMVTAAPVPCENRGVEPDPGVVNPGGGGPNSGGSNLRCSEARECALDCGVDLDCIGACTGTACPSGQPILQSFLDCLIADCLGDCLNEPRSSPCMTCVSAQCGVETTACDNHTCE